MSEELRQRGYLKKGKVHGVAVGPYEAFNLGSTTLNQLSDAGIVPKRNYGKAGINRPDMIVVDRRTKQPTVKLVVDYKNFGELRTQEQRERLMKKMAEQYCSPLGCDLAGITDKNFTAWLLVDGLSYQIIKREDEYPLDVPFDIDSSSGRYALHQTLLRLDSNLDRASGALQPSASVNPTQLADQTWQDIWLMCGEKPEACLETFIELLIFKFLSDLKLLTTDSSGVPVDFDTVLNLNSGNSLKYYTTHCRKAIKELFPPGQDGTSVINGLALSDTVADLESLFKVILQRFDQFGSLRYIDPEFKSRIFERFLKKSLSVKNWGQYFTPRNVLKAMVEMSGIEHLSPHSLVADPACGVGGFLLEPLMNKRARDFRAIDAPNLRYLGMDRDSKTVVLAKANMLVHLSELLEKDPQRITFFSKLLNSTFRFVGNSATGSLATAPIDEFDLVMTNPPYVVKGSGRQRDLLRENPKTADYYSVPGTGMENLFMQLIVNGLKPGARGLIIVPDGLLLRHTEEALRKDILKRCHLEAVISLPTDTFYSTPKKTYILIFRKKLDKNDRQTSPVFTYLVGEVGETRDAKRFATKVNDLPEMVSLFRQFQGNPEAFVPSSQRCRTFQIERFTQTDEHWLVNKWYPREIREDVGDVDEEASVDRDGLISMIADTQAELQNASQQLESATNRIPQPLAYVTVSLDDQSLFRMGIGKRVTKMELASAVKGQVPLYSANVEVGKEHGWLQNSNLSDFSHPSLLWSIDSDFVMTTRQAGDVFATTDHCGRIEILNPNLDADYCRAAIVQGFGKTYGFDRVTRPSLKRMEKVTFELPVLEDGITFDLEMQKALAEQYRAVEEALATCVKAFADIKEARAKVELPTSIKGGSGSLSHGRLTSVVSPTRGKKLASGPASAGAAVAKRPAGSAKATSSKTPRRKAAR